MVHDATAVDWDRVGQATSDSFCAAFMEAFEDPDTCAAWKKIIREYGLEG